MFVDITLAEGFTNEKKKKKGVFCLGTLKMTLAKKAFKKKWAKKVIITKVYCFTFSLTFICVYPHPCTQTKAFNSVLLKLIFKEANEFCSVYLHASFPIPQEKKINE